MGKIRTFLSLNIDQKSITKLEQIQKALKHLLKEYNIKWENPEKFHLTIRFLGYIDENEIEFIKEELKKISTGFEIIKYTVSGIDFFPHRKRPNVIFINLTEEYENANKFVTQIDQVITSFGIIPDKKFVPHITLGRFRHDKRKKITERFNFTPAPIELVFDSFYLMKSVLKSSGSEYEAIQKFKFN